MQLAYGHNAPSLHYMRRLDLSDGGGQCRLVSFPIMVNGVHLACEPFDTRTSSVPDSGNNGDRSSATTKCDVVLLPVNGIALACEWLMPAMATGEGRSTPKSYTRMPVRSAEAQGST